MENLSEKQRDIIAEMSQMLRSEQFVSLQTEHDRKSIFEILKITHSENRHSAFLAWMLSASLGIGNFPIECLLALYYGKTESIPKTGKLTTTFSIETEKQITGRRRIDIFGINKEDKVVFAIENKIKTSEHDNQTEAYYQWLKDKYPKSEYQLVCLYLTVDDEEADCPEFVNITYQDMFDDVIKPCLKHPGLSEENQWLLQHYANNLTTPFSDGSGIEAPIAYVHKDECNKIWSRYKDVLEEIFIANDSSEETVDKPEEYTACLKKMYQDYQATFDEIYLTVDTSDAFRRTPNNRITTKKGENFQRLVRNGKLQVGEYLYASYKEKTFCGIITESQGQYVIMVLDENKEPLRLESGDIVGGAPSTAHEEAQRVYFGEFSKTNGMKAWKNSGGKTLNQLCGEM